MNRTIVVSSWLFLLGLMVVAAPVADVASAQVSKGKPRVEKDLLGEKEIPSRCLLWRTDRSGAGEFPALRS